MPEIATLEPTQETCKALYLQGFDHSQIAEKTGVKQGTIRTWIYRYDWRTLRSTISTHLETRVTTPLIAQSVKNASAKVRDALSTELSQTCDQLAKVKPGRTLRKLNERQEVIAKVVQSANKVFGWDQQSTSTLASVQSLSSALPGDDDLRKTVVSPVVNSSLSGNNCEQLVNNDHQVVAQASVTEENPK